MPLHCPTDANPGEFLRPAPFVPFEMRKPKPELARCQRCGRPAMEHWVVRP